jgi:outer membrane lipoprotein-sorting protein
MLRIASLMLATAVAAGFAAQASAQTADEIVAKYIQARGGMESLKAVKSIRYTAKAASSGVEIPVTVEQKRPSSIRISFTLQGLTGIQAYDGQLGWAVLPFQGKKDAELMSSDDLRAIVEQADFDGPLVDYRQKGNTVELVGKESVEGADAYKLKLTLKSGEASFVYVDADSYLLIREEARRTVGGTETEGITSYRDYKRVGNVVIAHTIENGTRQTPSLQKISIENVELNLTFNDSLFKMPEAK